MEWLTVVVVWEKWFIANFEELDLKGILDRNAGPASAHSTGSAGSNSQAGSGARSVPENLTLRSSTGVTLVDEKTHSQ